MYIDTQVRKNCWNWYWSYGEICVGCGCCSKNPITRAKARLEVCEEELKKKQNFMPSEEISPEWQEQMKKNNQSWIDYFKREIKYYQGRLKKLGVEV